MFMNVHVFLFGLEKKIGGLCCLSIKFGNEATWVLQ